MVSRVGRVAAVVVGRTIIAGRAIVGRTIRVLVAAAVVGRTRVVVRAVLGRAIRFCVTIGIGRPI